MESENLLDLNLKEVNGKKLYKACVKNFNKKNLQGKVDTPWRSFLSVEEDVTPQWSSFYKPPLTKKWRLTVENFTRYHCG